MSTSNELGERVTVGLVQSRCVDDSAENLRRAVDRIEEAARGGAQIVCLQELFGTPYFCQVHDPAIFDQAEPIPGPTTETLGAVAKRHGIVVIASIFEKRAPGLHHNTAAIGIESPKRILPPNNPPRVKPAKRAVGGSPHGLRKRERKPEATISYSLTGR